MVAKISTGSNMFGALAYNQNKVDEEQGKVLFSNRMLLCEDGSFSIGECMRSFELQMPSHIHTAKPIVHISLNPHPDDRLTDESLATIAQEYMEKLGYGNQPYMVYKHEDIDRHHVHIVGLRVDENGNRFPISSSIAAANKSPVNWNRNMGFTRQRDSSGVNARNSKKWITPPEM